jgi:hypothetical protein
VDEFEEKEKDQRRKLFGFLQLSVVKALGYDWGDNGTHHFGKIQCDAYLVERKFSLMETEWMVDERIFTSQTPSRTGRNCSHSLRCFFARVQKWIGKISIDTVRYIKSGKTKRIQ